MTDLGRIRPGGRVRALPAVLRGRVSHQAYSGFPVADPCRPTLQPAEFGSENSLIRVEEGFEESNEGRVTSVVIRPANADQCLPTPSRRRFQTTVLNAPCQLLGADGGKREVDLRTPCRWRAGFDLRVRRTLDERLPGAAPPNTAGGFSIDRTTRWRFHGRHGVVIGHGLRVDVEWSGRSPGRDDALITLTGITNRLATAIPYDVQADAFAVGLSAELRHARPQLGDAVVGDPMTGADTAITSVYRHGRRAGVAVFFYDTQAAIKHRFDYHFTAYDRSYRVVCPQYSAGCDV